MWPFAHRGHTEKRESGGGYEDSILTAFETAATTTPRAAATAALEAASGLYARCLASATVEGPAGLAAAVTPAVLAQIGRSMIRSGEQVFVIDVDADGAARLMVVGHHDVYGGRGPADVAIPHVGLWPQRHHHAATPGRGRDPPALLMRSGSALGRRGPAGRGEDCRPALGRNRRRARG